MERPQSTLKSTTVQCKFKGQGGTVLFRLFDPEKQVNLRAINSEILDRCFSLIGQRSRIHWIQDGCFGDNLILSKRALRFPPMVLKNIQTYSVSHDNFVEGFQYICKNILSREKKPWLSGVVVNLCGQNNPSGAQILEVVESMRKLSVNLRETFEEEDRETNSHRILISMPATQHAINVIGRQFGEFQFL